MLGFTRRFLEPGLAEGREYPHARLLPCVDVAYLINSARMCVSSDRLEIVGGEAGSDGEAEELRDRIGDR